MPTPPAESVVVSTPSRLHFGLLRFQQPEGRSFGGLGMMIDRPRVELQMTPSDAWSTAGPNAASVEQYAALALSRLPAEVRPRALRIRVDATIPNHFGLGSGTQLALATAAGVRALAGLSPVTDAAELTMLVDRGRRSAVGSHGFVHGGLIWERGWQSGETLAPLAARVSLPESWRVVLATPTHLPGRSGLSERSAFRALPPVPPSMTDQLRRLAEEHILPAARCADLNNLGDALYEYGRLAGKCFAHIQGGTFASPEIAACVAAIRACGVRGVGQSSWGPTVYALLDSEQRAQDLASELRGGATDVALNVEVVLPDNRGAAIRLASSAGQS